MEFVCLYHVFGLVYHPYDLLMLSVMAVFILIGEKWTLVGFPELQGHIFWVLLRCTAVLDGMHARATHTKPRI